MGSTEAEAALRRVRCRPTMRPIRGIPNPFQALVWTPEGEDLASEC